MKGKLARGAVSVVIPVHNRAASLRRAIESVQAQTYAVEKIIVVDDASTDTTPELAHNMAEQDPRIELIRQPVRKGAGAARNVGWRAATSDWIAFLDSDDQWLPEKLAKQFDVLERDGSAVASFTGHAGTGVEYTYIPPAEPTAFDLKFGNILGTTSTALVQRSAMNAVGGFDETLPSCQDWDLWIRLRSLGRFVVVLEPLVLFEQSGSDRITKNRKAVMAGHAIILKRILADVQGEARRQIKASHHERMARIMHHDFASPLGALWYSTLSAMTWPNKTAVQIVVERLRYLLRRPSRNVHLL